MADEARSRLGRGLAALIGDVGDAGARARPPRSQRKVPIEFVKRQSAQSAPHFADAELDELAASIRERGIIQPIVVRTCAAPTIFEIIAGERRWRAAQRAGLHDVPVVVLEVERRAKRSSSRSSRTCSAPISIRSKRRPAIRRWSTEFNHTQDEIAKIVGKSRSHVANTLRLLEAARRGEGLHQRRQAIGRARARAGRSADPEELAREIVERGSTSARSRRSARSRPRPAARKSARTCARSRTPTRWRWKSACRTRSASWSASTTAARAACCACAIVRSSSLTTWCVGSKSAPAGKSAGSRLRKF